MLSAWFRFKYPNVVDGALAASAPIYIVANLTAPDAFFGLVTKVCVCVFVVCCLATKTLSVNKNCGIVAIANMCLCLCTYSCMCDFHAHHCDVHTLLVCTQFCNYGNCH